MDDFDFPHLRACRFRWEALAIAAVTTGVVAVGSGDLLNLVVRVVLGVVAVVGLIAYVVAHVKD